MLQNQPLGSNKAMGHDEQVSPRYKSMEMGTQKNFPGSRITDGTT